MLHSQSSDEVLPCGAHESRGHAIHSGMLRSIQKFHLQRHSSMPMLPAGELEFVGQCEHFPSSPRYSFELQVSCCRKEVDWWGENFADGLLVITLGLMADSTVTN